MLKTHCYQHATVRRLQEKGLVWIPPDVFFFVFDAFPFPFPFALGDGLKGDALGEVLGDLLGASLGNATQKILSFSLPRGNVPCSAVVPPNPQYAILFFSKHP